MRWKRDFDLLLVVESSVLNPSLKTMESRATALMQNILKEEIGLELLQNIPSTLQRISMEKLLIENCAEERSRLGDGLDAIAVAETIIQELKTLGFT